MKVGLLADVRGLVAPLPHALRLLREEGCERLVCLGSTVEGADEDETPLRDRLRAEKHPDGRPVYSLPFCLGLLVYFVFAMQCLSTVAIVRRETGGWKWPIFQFAYMTGSGYALAVLIYQIGTRISG